MASINDIYTKIKKKRRHKKQEVTLQKQYDKERI